MKALKNERGSILLYVTGSLIVMALFVGLAIDGGWTIYVRDQGQAAMDAAALSAASVIPDYKKGQAPSSKIELRAAVFAQKAASSKSDHIRFIHMSCCYKSPRAVHFPLLQRGEGGILPATAAAGVPMSYVSI